MHHYDAEYHSFGPWIFEISEKHPLPPIFIPYYKKFDDQLLLVKIPRNIDRKDAKPGMDLYDYVIGMYEDYMYILERKDNTVEENKITYREIEGLNILNDLLIGELTLYLTNRVLKIPYNTVSDDLIHKMVKISRDRYANAVCLLKGKNAYEPNQLKKTDVLFSNLLKDMERNGDLFNNIFVQPAVNLKTNKSNILRKIFKITREKLLNSLYLTNDKELAVITRGQLITKGRDAIYSYSHTYIPFEKLQDIVLDNDENYNNLKRLFFRTDHHTFMFYFENGNKQIEDTYGNFLMDFMRGKHGST